MPTYHEIIKLYEDADTTRQHVHFKGEGVVLFLSGERKIVIKDICNGQTLILSPAAATAVRDWLTSLFPPNEETEQ